MVPAQTALEAYWNRSKATQGMPDNILRWAEDMQEYWASRESLEEMVRAQCLDWPEACNYIRATSLIPEVTTPRSPSPGRPLLSLLEAASFLPA